MFLLYSFFLMMIVSFSNFYIVWILMEFNFVFFLLFSLLTFSKNYGLIIYYFIQGFLSMLLLICVHFFLVSTVFWILLMKLGSFPFFYWVVVVTLKIDLFLNIFILGLQKIPMFWLFWLVAKCSLLVFFILFYLTLFFVFFSLMSVSDVWLIIIYSSLVTTSVLLLALYGSYFWFAFSLYLMILVLMLWVLKLSSNFSVLIFILYFFLSLPPFFLFFLKVSIVFSLLFYSKMVFFLFLFDVLIMTYYFTLIFNKFMMFEYSLSLLMVNFFMIFTLLFLSNYVTLVIFN